MTDEEDDRLVRIALQRWFTRICEDQVLLRDDELRSFVESDFGVGLSSMKFHHLTAQYQPIAPPNVRKAPAVAVPQVLTATLSKIVRRGPLDEDDELQGARPALEKLESGWGAAATSVGALGKSRRGWLLDHTGVTVLKSSICACNQ